jgi:hypothetical protein
MSKGVILWESNKIAMFKRMCDLFLFLLSYITNIFWVMAPDGHTGSVSRLEFWVLVSIYIEVLQYLITIDLPIIFEYLLPTVRGRYANSSQKECWRAEEGTRITLTIWVPGASSTPVRAAEDNAVVEDKLRGPQSPGIGGGAVGISENKLFSELRMCSVIITSRNNFCYY